MAVSLVVAGCGGRAPSTSGGGYAPLVGSWRPISMFYTSKADTARRLELVSMGYRDPLVLQADGSFDQGPFGSGTAAVVGDEIHLRFGPDRDHLCNYTVRGDTLVLRDEKDFHFDFDGDGADDPANMSAVLIRE